MDVSIVVPFYNESESVSIFFKRIIPILRRSKCSFEIVCVNDGSKDNTIDKLLLEKKEHPEIKIVDFSRNFGKDAAMTAGMDFSEGKCVIPMDCDLQDPPELITDMIKKWKEGFDVVLAKRSDRSSDSFLKKITANLFYDIYNRISDYPLPKNVGDFRLMDRKVVDVIKEFPERTRFMKGLFSFAGFKTAYLDYVRPIREKGTTKWSYWKLWNYAIDGITSFSTFPLKICTYVGFFVTMLAFARGIWITFRVFFQGIDVPGYASLMVAMLFLGGIQMIFLGVIGEYIGRIYIETKQRPIYIIKNIIK
ncbi:MAG: glycosyltransferase family 2 protein [Alphaproteobacteria bacterium]|nr:glycosyltransferase family 2 protein [Alphaproteobacteria bacterium]